MTGTVSCEPGGADALLRACQRASAGGGQLRVAVTAPIVRRILEASGLDRLVPVYPSVPAASAAGVPVSSRWRHDQAGGRARPRSCHGAGDGRRGSLQQCCGGWSMPWTTG